MTTFFDTSALIALMKTTETYHEWSYQQFKIRKSHGPIVISPIVFSEYCVSMASLDHVQRALCYFGIEAVPESNEALFRASRAYMQYKKINKGPKLSLLPDFLIGASAETAGCHLVTANARDFQKYFDGLKLIYPNHIGTPSP
jgi:predicted nucleic acid-binding protein